MGESEIAVQGLYLGRVQKVNIMKSNGACYCRIRQKTGPVFYFDGKEIENEQIF